MINAPNAGEKPAWEDKTTIKKHRDNETTSNVSSFRYFFKRLKIVGRKNIPETNHRTRKNTNFRIDRIISVPSNERLMETVDKITIKTTATRSSIIKAPNTIPANF
ncbi:hypothetical protein D3C86_1656980 [compost metagenome]